MPHAAWPASHVRLDPAVRREPSAPREPLAPHAGHPDDRRVARPGGRRPRLARRCGGRPRCSSSPAGCCSSSATPSRASRPSSSRTGGSCSSACAGGWRSSRARRDAECRPRRWRWCWPRICCPLAVAGAADGGRRGPARGHRPGDGRARRLDGAAAARRAVPRQADPLLLAAGRRRLPPSAPRSSRSGCPARWWRCSGAAAIGWLAGAMFGPTAGLWAALCYATMLLPFAVSLSPLHDLVMVPLVTLAIGAFWHARHAASTAARSPRWTLRRRGRPRPVGARQGPDRRRPGRRRRRHAGCCGRGRCRGGWSSPAPPRWPSPLAIAWPWYAAMERAVPGYLHYFFMERHVGGFTDDTQRHAGRPFSITCRSCSAGALAVDPVPAAPPRARRSTTGERLLWAWLLADVVLLSLAGSKLATYVLPAMPALAGAVRAARAAAAGRPRRRRAAGRVRRSAPPSLTMSAAAAGPGMLGVGGSNQPPLSAYAWLVGARRALLGPTSGATTGAARRRWPSSPRWRSSSPALVVLPLVAERLTGRGLAAQFNAAGGCPPACWSSTKASARSSSTCARSCAGRSTRAASSGCRGSRSATSPARPERRWRSPPTGCPAWPRSTSSTPARPRRAAS